MSKDYTKINPVGQLDKSACWAACLSWWLEAVGGGRPLLSQNDLIEEFDKHCGADGSMPIGFLRDVVARDSRFKISTAFYTASHFISRGFPISDTPVIIIYKPPVIEKIHFNVIFDKIGNTVNCMEPYHPIGALDGKKTGKFERRPNSYFINSEEIGLAWATADFN
jgi:hypothetical protein